MSALSLFPLLPTSFGPLQLFSLTPTQIKPQRREGGKKETLLWVEGTERVYQAVEYCEVFLTDKLFL